MQGYRHENEDAHLVSMNYNDEREGQFAVFDGHGGKSPAIFSQHIMMNRIDAFKDQFATNFEEAAKNL